MSTNKTEGTEAQKQESARLVQRHKKGFRLLYDDFLEPEIFNNLRDFITGNGFLWNFRLGVVGHTKWDYAPTEDFAFSHLVWHQTSGVVSPQAQELQPLITVSYTHLTLPTMELV